MKHNCESVLESFVSKYENHFDQRRNTDEDTSSQEFEISINGSNFAHCDTVVEETMDASLRSDFYRTSVVEKLKTFTGDSEVLNRMLTAKNNLPFMS